jgi:hypothetical protein
MMDIQKFVGLRENLFHLTDKNNLDSILSDYTLKSTQTLTGLVKIPDRQNFLRTRRVGHKRISDGSLAFLLRDQDPLFEKIVTKNLEKTMSFGDFVYLLNSKVFFWATEKDLRTHYARYEKQNERPVILRINTAALFAVNKHEPKFCKLNSGAPRCSSYHKEGAPPRGSNTFLDAASYPGTPSSVREVTFDRECKLPETLYLSSHPDKSFKRI